MSQAKSPDATPDFPVTVVLPIQWGDQDAFGHVNNTVPIRWFESARMAYMTRGGVHEALKASGLGPILAAVTCNYRRQLHFPDTVHVGARVSRLGRSSLTMEHVVYSERLGVIAADGSSTIVMFDYAANRPRRVPEALREAFEGVEGRSLDIGSPASLDGGESPPER